MAKEKIIKWVEGKMFLKPGKKYSMTGKELVDMGYRVDSDGFLMANGLTYTVEIGMPWMIHQLKPVPLVIKDNTPFKKIQERYPDAIKFTAEANKLMSNKEILKAVYGKDADKAMVLKDTSTALFSNGRTKATIRAIVSIQAKAEKYAL